MRSSNKSRSRHKNNNNNNNRRSSTNVVNRVFDSSGPEGKVRGTPQQIVDKYQSLAQDAQLNGDRVAAENFLQHAEHFSRLLADAMREQALKREQHEAQQGQRRDNQQSQHNNNNQNQNQDQQQNQSQNQNHSQNQPAPAVSNAHNEAQPDVGVADTAADTGLVDTPENPPVQKRKPRPKKPEAKVEAKVDVKAEEPAAPEAAAKSEQSAAE